LSSRAAEAELTLTPKQLYRALLRAPYADSELPRGFRGARVRKTITVGDQIGFVTVSFGADPYADGSGYVDFIVYLSPALARAHLKARYAERRVGPVSGYSLPSSVITGSDARGGYISMEVAVGRVIVAGETQRDRPRRGDATGARRLLVSAVAHRERVKRRG
jgi:hypothetical protein